MLKPNFENPITMNDVRTLIQIELNWLFCLGEDSGMRFAQGYSPKNPDKDIEKALTRIEEKIDQFFLDNR